MNGGATLAALVREIHRVRNTAEPSCVLRPRHATPTPPDQPVGVLLLKPSSGYIPPATLAAILDRLTGPYGYAIEAAHWWSGPDLQRAKLMARHYPGFFRVAHGGWPALGKPARGLLTATANSVGSRFQARFGAPFAPDLVRTPYDLIADGFAAEWLNHLWEQDRSGEQEPLARVQRLDEDSLALGLRFDRGPSVPERWHHRGVILLNGFFAQLERDFETHGCVALCLRRRPDSTTSWEALRTRFAGKTNPFEAPAGTVRGDAARGVLPVERVSVLANVIHLSANEAEGRREVEGVWWNPELLPQVFGEVSPRRSRGP